MARVPFVTTAWQRITRRRVAGTLGGAARILATPASIRLGLVAGSRVSPEDSHAMWVPSDVEWASFSEEVQRQRAWGIVAAADGGRIIVPVHHRPLVDAELRVQMAKALVLERVTLEVDEALRQADIDARVLKGPAAAHLLYDDATVRSFSDVDVLVPSDALDRAVGVVELLGGVRHRRERVPGATALIGKGVGLTLDNGVEVDLHRRLGQGTHQFGSAERILFEHPEPFLLAGRELFALAPPVAFVHACLHAVGAGDGRRITPLRDVAQHLVRPLDVDAVKRAATELDAEGATAAAVIAAVTLLGLELPGHPLVPWAVERRAGLSELLWLAIAGHEGPIPRIGLAIAALVSQPDAAHLSEYLRIQLGGRIHRKTLL